MAEKVLVVCDLHRDDHPGRFTVRLELDGRTTRLDLCDEHLEQVRETLEPLLRVAHAEPRGARRRSGGVSSDGTRTRRVDGSRRSRADERAQIRDWARKHGYSVRDYGRLPADAVAAYRSSRSSRTASSRAS